MIERQIDSVREQAGRLDRQATKRQGPGDIYNGLRSPEGLSTRRSRLIAGRWAIKGFGWPRNAG